MSETLTEEALPRERVRPVDESERVAALDALRGAAVLGILLMNITSFGLPVAAYLDPTIAGGASGLNLLVYLVNMVLFEGKMRATFSLLFGAGVVLMTARAERRGAGVEVADVYYRRNLWLLAFGLIHAYFFWMGDILYVYALCALFLFPFRKLAPRPLIALGLVCLAVAVPINYGESMELAELKAKAAAAESARKAGKTLTTRQKEALRALADKLELSKPNPDDVAEEVAAHRAGGLQLFILRARLSAFFQTEYFFWHAFWDAIGMMFLGMALLKLGVLTGEWSRNAYAWMAGLGYAVGLPFSVWLVARAALSGWDPVVIGRVMVVYDVQRLAIALGQVGLLMLVLKSGRLPGLTGRLADVGRTALTAYLGTTLICTTLFEGYGFGLFDRLSRAALYLVVPAVWAFWLVACPLWLRAFRHGPMEWLWRSLTYWKPQPWRHAPGTGAPEAGTDTEEPQEIGS